MPETVKVAMMRARTQRGLNPARWLGRSERISEPRRVLAEDGPYSRRLYQGPDVDDPYRVAVCANVVPNASVASYAAVVGDGTALVGTIPGGTGAGPIGVLLTGLGHGLAEFGDHTRVSVSLLVDERELLPELTEELERGGPSRHLARRLRGLTPTRQVADQVCAHLRRLQATVVEQPATGRCGEAVPQHSLLALAFRLAWYASHIARAHQIGLQRALDLLATVVVLNDTVDEMRSRLAWLDSAAASIRCNGAPDDRRSPACRTLRTGSTSQRTVSVPGQPADSRRHVGVDPLNHPQEHQRDGADRR